MKWIFFVIISFSFSTYAEEFGPPISVCLNKHTIPYIHSEIEPEKIVDKAYKECADIVSQWREERASLPTDMKIRQDKELYDMYVRMIKIRRKSEVNEN